MYVICTLDKLYQTKEEKEAALNVGFFVKIKQEQTVPESAKLNKEVSKLSSNYKSDYH